MAVLVHLSLPDAVQQSLVASHLLEVRGVDAEPTIRLQAEGDAVDRADDGAVGAVVPHVEPVPVLVLQTLPEPGPG